MGAKRCNVPGCKSAQNRVEDAGVTFHQLPANLPTRLIWLKASRCGDSNNNNNNVKVCSRHFREADFKLIKNKYFLVKGTYPTIFPWGVYTHAAEKAPEDDDPVSATGEEDPLADAVPPLDSSVVASELPSLPVVMVKEEPETAPAAAKVKRESAAVKRHSIAAVETIKKEPIDAAEAGPKRLMRKSMESATTSLAKKVEPVAGKEIQAMDFQNVWHKAKIVEVDLVERELLIHFEDNNKEKLVDEWIPMDSSRLRPLHGLTTEPNLTMSPLAAASTLWPAASSTRSIPRAPTAIPLAPSRFQVGEKCLARWSDSRKFKATVQKILPNGLYEVLFDDGFLKTVKVKHISKLKGTSVRPIRGGARGGAGTAPLPQVSLVDGEEWYCQWVDDCPVGKLTVADSNVPNTKVRMIEVADRRLPSGWVKYFAERVHVGSKWDVVVVAPSGRRFRGRQDVKAYIEETSAQGTLNLADFDFAMHKKRAKEKGVYTYTDNYRKFLKSLYPTLAEIDATPVTPADLQAAVMAQIPPMLMESVVAPVPQDWLMVDGMKVQIIDNLLRCPEEGCFKNFRKENLLKIHIKHYHELMAKKITATPTMTDLAYKRTQSLVVVEDAPSPLSRTMDGVAGGSPTKSVRRVAEKTKNSPDKGLETVAQASDSAIEGSSSRAQSILEQALNSGLSSTGRAEDIPDRNFPKATPLTDSKKGGAGTKRKYTKRTNELDSPRPQQPKKIKVEPLEAVAPVNAEGLPTVPPSPAVAGPSSSQDDTLSLGSPMEATTSAAIPQQYIDENGDVIKIVRMRQEEIINCLCHYPEEDGLMIQCDLCLCWQHGRCNDIEKESQVPDKYVCYICRNPEKGRQSMKYIHDQDWLYDGKLPRSTYHTQGTANDAKRTETLKTIHTLTGNLLELKRLMHGLRGKMNIADNKDHPKLYLWSERWENADGTPASGDGVSPQKGAVPKEEERNNAPKPEAAIDSRECQRRLIEHIKNVQAQLNRRLDSIEVLVDQIEGESDMGAMSPEEDAKCTPRIKQTMHMMMDDLATMKEIAQC